MADDDELFEDDENLSPKEGGEPGDGLDAGEEDGGAGQSLGISKADLLAWLTRRRGWVLIIGLAIAQALFGTIMLYLRSEAKPTAETPLSVVQNLAVDMLGYEVKIGQMYQLIPMRGGKRMTVGLDMVLILGQLPEEQIEGSPRPSPEEIELFAAAIQSMEPGIRSRVNALLQQMPTEAYGTVEPLVRIKEDVKAYINDTLDGLDFGSGLRPGLSKRRVTDVLLPMFIRQML